MSADASGRLSAAPRWLRYGLIAGSVAFACTLVANLALSWLSPADLCRLGPLIIPLLNLGAFLVFLLTAAAAGFLTARAGRSGPDPTLAGLLVGVLGGCALIVLLPFVPSIGHRLQDLASACTAPGSSFFFGFGSSPPGFAFGSPPPGFVMPTPPPEAFMTPPPEAFAPPTGRAAMVGELLGMVVTILIGIGGAVGVATIAGLAGRRDPAPGPQANA
jgi:hypothetical protein